MKRKIEIIFDDNINFVDIISDITDFCIVYGNGFNGHGLQCVYTGEDKRNEQITKLLDEISDNVREIYKISKEELKQDLKNKIQECLTNTQNGGIMSKLTLEQVLSNDVIKNNIAGNFNFSKEKIEEAISKTNKDEKENFKHIFLKVNDKLIRFENTLFANPDKTLYFLESRSFDLDDNMISSYLELLNPDGTVYETKYIDDIWEYADWKSV